MPKMKRARLKVRDYVYTFNMNICLVITKLLYISFCMIAIFLSASAEHKQYILTSEPYEVLSVLCNSIVMLVLLFQFYDGPKYSLYLRTFHASSEPQVMRSTSNRMVVIFMSYHNVGHRGFRARYTSDEPSRK
jgi:hypothetical protein